MFGWFKTPEIGNARKSARPARRRLRFDALEHRLALAGDVTAVVDMSGNLVITGDAEANAIGIVGTATPGEYVVFGTDGTTTINGGSDPVTLSGASGFDIDMGEGADRLSLAALAVSEAASIDMGLGSDALAIFLCRINGALDVQTGDGDDVVGSAFSSVGGATTIDLGDGNDKLVVSFSRFEGVTTINTGVDFETDSTTDDDQVLIAASRFKAAATINLGDGNDRLAIAFSRFDVGLTADGGDSTDSLLNRFNSFGSPPGFSNFE